MNYGDNELRRLTEIDEITERRDVRHFKIDGQEKAVLLNEEGQRPRWDFAIENPFYGKVVCSFYPDEAEEQLKGYFGSSFAYEKDGKSVTDGFPMWGCTDAGMKYLQQHIQQSLNDALCGLVMEAELHGLLARNGHDFMIANLSLKIKRQINQIRAYYRGRMNQRLGTRQGDRKDMVDFLLRAYQAYCNVADELGITATEPFIQNLTKQVSQEEFAAHMKRKKERKKKPHSESTMGARGLIKQLHQYELTYKELIDRCHYNRWIERERN